MTMNVNWIVIPRRDVSGGPENELVLETVPAMCRSK